MCYLVGFGLMLTILLGLFAVLKHCSTFPHYLVFVLFIASLHLTREKKFLQNFISSRDGPVQSAETRQKWKHARRLTYYGMMAEKKDKKTTQQVHLLYMQQMKGSLLVFSTSAFSLMSIGLLFGITFWWKHCCLLERVWNCLWSNSMA